jgi:chromosomal replication initiator protein
MKKLAEDRNLILPNEVIDHLILHTRRELPPLIDLLDRLHRQSMVTGRKISMRLVREIIQ